MGCDESKVEDFLAVALCRQRNEFLKAASKQRYALITTHVAYFHSLREISDAFCKFVKQDPTTSSSSTDQVQIQSRTTRVPSLKLNVFDPHGSKLTSSGNNGLCASSKQQQGRRS
ncbi:hypothetical protein E2542_SST08353 [Spatholobus suberectus]|nr:hypothetical protein E2542_SST08353 [Spatholobus suberectus]